MIKIEIDKKNAIVTKSLECDTYYIFLPLQLYIYM